MKKIFDEIEIISTFDTGKQLFLSVFEVKIDKINTEKIAKEYFKKIIEDESKKTPVKISTCFLNCKKSDVPKWVIKTNGKLFF